jgi:hypothetical protein
MQATTYREVEVQLHSFLTSALDVGSGKFIAKGSIHPSVNRRWEVPRAKLEDSEGT